MRDAAFWILAGTLLAAAAAVVTARSLFRAAFALALALASTAGLYLLAAAPLLAAVQILLYTGGVLTLVVFALVIAGGETEGARWRRPVPSLATAIVVFIALARIVGRAGLPPGPFAGVGRGAAIGRAILSEYLVAFELLSVLLLGAVFGALLLARRDRAS